MAISRTLTLKATTPSDEVQESTIKNVNPNLTSTVQYQAIQTAMRALNNLTNNTYVDTIVTDENSLNELVS